jgi:hypothetical protein
MEDGSRLLSGGLKYQMDVLAIELRNLEALGLAQQKLIEGIGALLQHQTEMAGDALRRALDAKALASAPPPSSLGAALVSQITAFKTSIVEGQARSTMLSELAMRSGGEVASILQARMLAALDELKAALEPTPDTVGGTLAKVAPPVLTAQPAPVA